MNATVGNHAVKHDALIESLLNPSSYVHSVQGPVVLHETHISWVLLAGKFAYKIKKPIVTDFLDYGSLANRHHACCEELRLGSRYALGLYLDIVPITFEDGQIRMDGDAQPIEFAVRMRRFDDNALLSQRLRENRIPVESIVQLATTLASFHSVALKTERPYAELVPKILDQAKQNLELLLSEPLLRQDPEVQSLEVWTATHFANNRKLFAMRALDGFMRECHGDLHCGNIVFWNGNWVPFDGIEFNSDYSWIDVASDVAFLVMDLQELGHADLSAAFLNAYLEETGDYQALPVMRWYLVYRALVRAKVEVLRSRQENQVQRLDSNQITSAKEYIRLAERLAKSGTKKLWITHGVSGSGKTTQSRKIIEREGAIRIRSDVERKRIFKSPRASLSAGTLGQGMYSSTATDATYQRLFDIAKSTLQSDFSAIIDATFLRHDDRHRFQELAASENAQFQILDFQVDEQILKKRIAQRQLSGGDASDATLSILANQLRSQELLTGKELAFTISGIES